MRIRRLVTTVLVCTAIGGGPLLAQSSVDQATEPAHTPAGGARPQIVRRGMVVLGSWAAANLAAGTTGATELTLPAYRAESHRLEKTLLFNAGLDIGYMTLGGWLWERGNRGRGLPSAGVGAERLTGWGQALVLQGAFLFVFDVVLARRLAGDRRSLQDR